MRRQSLPILVSVVVAVALGAGVTTFVIRGRQLVPTDISKQVTSAIFLAQGKTSEVKKGSFKYDKNLKQMSYIAVMSDKEVIVSEQPTPDVFTDVPTYFSKWIASTGEYTSFQSVSGKVHLSRNKNYGPSSVAILNEKGTLLFAKPKTSLTDDQWKQFFLSLKQTD